ncbi:methyltransferase domain-containing protein [Schaalia cardiffensis]|uniref:methyltransferase n=1 Tax=Schaalia cardiffensis TaxID=181487 RepID=UPI0018E7459F|nr:methyltransferase [Schaalia cardiffensis]MBJ2329374.1 methyltransferase domain-containing protein [Schaalia cardiffensis]
MQCEHWDRGACRSCRYLDVPYGEQVAAKSETAAEALALVPTAAGVHWLSPRRSAPTAFRTSAKLVVGGTRRRPTLGILGPDRRGVDLPGWPIQHPAINRATPALKRFIRSLDLIPYDVPTKNGELKYILLTVGADDALMCRFVLRTRDRVTDIRLALPDLVALVPNLALVTANIHPAHEALIEGPDEIILSKRRMLPIRAGDLDLALGPGSFIQTNAAVAGDLYRQAADWAALPLASGDAPQTLWDLYCGIGGFALHAANAGIPRVTGVEVSERAIASAIRSASQAGLSRTAARFIAADATAWAAQQDPATAPDVLIVNPPRRGIGDALAQWVNEHAGERVIYSSCNPTSLARDLEAMPAYRCVEARLFDMFHHTDHVEVAVLLRRTPS